MSRLIEGTVVAAFGRHYQIELSDGVRVSGFPRGKKSIYACGDRVALERSSTDQAQIVRHLPRNSLLFRSDAYRQKLIAANATQLILVVATEPSFSDELLARALVAGETEGLRSIVVLNKVDLADQLPAARSRVTPLAQLGYTVIEMSARQDARPLLPYLAGELSVLVGQSGMGKSTLVNALIPGAAAATREVSEALASGKHTTTYARRYSLADNDGFLIDSPGLQEFGLAHLSRGMLEQGFVDFRPYLADCRFRDCTHRSEPDCAIKAAVSEGKIDQRRYAIFLRLGSGAF